MPLESATVPAAVSLVHFFEENATVVAVNDGKVSENETSQKTCLSLSYNPAENGSVDNS